MSKPQKKYGVGIHKRTQQGVSAKLASYILSTSGPCYNLMSALFSSQDHHVAYMCPDIIF